ncbi:MAG: DUF368 domain-containing protein [Thermodesulfobacteriota bacterium]
MGGKTKAPRSVIALVVVALKGFVMGGADIVPGVSGGTMAFITGIYERLLAALAAFDLHLLRLLRHRQFRQAAAHVQLDFLLALSVGLLAAVVSLSGLLHGLLQTQPSLVFAFFFGLVLASVWAIGRQIPRWGKGVWAALVLGVAGGVAVTSFVPAESSHSLAVIFVSGAVAISAMLMPGVSGAFILLVLGQYEYITGLLRQPLRPEALVGLGVFFLGCACGIAVFSRVLRWWLSRSYAATLAFLTGFMLGAVRTLWPWAAAQGHTAPFGAIVAWLCLGVVLVVGSVLAAHWKEKKTV